MPPPPDAPRRGIIVNRFDSAAQADRHDLEYWMKIPDTERVLQVWRLSKEQWSLSPDLVDESGLCRSVAGVRRG